MDRRLAFDGVAEVYDRARPLYPDEHFDRLFALLPDNAEVLEVGPGTGQASMALLDRGAAVTAAEIGPRLAAFLREKFAKETRLVVLNAAFEDVGVPHQSFDAVVAATCYHWVRGPARIERPLEVLKPGGWFAVINVLQVESDVDRGYFERVQPIYDAFDNGNPPGWTPRFHETAEPPIAGELRKSGRYESVAMHRIKWDQTYTSQQYRELLWTYSGTQSMAEPARSDMVDQLVAVIDDEFDGVLTRPLSATLMLAQAPA